MPPIFTVLLRSLLLVTVVAALALAAMPNPSAVPGLPGATGIHIAGFAVLTLIARGGYPELGVAGLCGILLGFGMLTEAIQALPSVPRQASCADLLADCLGIAGGLAITGTYHVLARWARQ